MKKIISSLVMLLVCCMAAQAQQFQVVKGGSVIKTWTINQVDKVMMVEDTTEPVIQLLKSGEVVIEYTKSQADKVVVKEGVKVTSIIDIPATQEMYLGMTKTLKPTILPSDASDKNLVWTSSDPEKVMVSQNGEIAAIGEGTAIVRVTADDGSEAYAECEVTVVNTISCITLDKNYWMLDLSETSTAPQTTITATINHGDETPVQPEWSSSDVTIATVSVDPTDNKKCVITGKKGGLVTITCKSADATHPQYAYCTIFVKQYVTSLAIDKTIATMKPGGMLELVATVLPEDAHIKALKWTSSDPTVATVNAATGVVKALKKGEATITATSTDGSNKTVSCTIKVVDPFASAYEELEDGEFDW